MAMGMGMGGNENSCRGKSNGSEVLEWKWDENGNDSTGMGWKRNNNSHSRIPPVTGQLSVVIRFQVDVACSSTWVAWDKKTQDDSLAVCLASDSRKSRNRDSN